MCIVATSMTPRSTSGRHYVEFQSERWFQPLRGLVRTGEHSPEEALVRMAAITRGAVTTADTLNTAIRH